MFAVERRLGLILSALLCVQYQRSFHMLRKIILGLAAITATGTALPAAAEAQGYRHYDSRYSRAYDGYRSGYYDRGYDRRAYDRRSYGRGGYDGGYYGRGSYDRGYYGRGGYDRGYYGRSQYGYDDRRYRRCGSGTTGAIVGGAAGALVGREIARGGRRYSHYGRGGNGTLGAIVGGAAGALLGREVGRSC